mmetsp:Transcript_42539/g.98619  ORF Transcript_42539/g.98619 Transcript_42539/m.98619 type:complete len:118 (-) Transcript_42539:59-412(-)
MLWSPMGVGFSHRHPTQPAIATQQAPHSPPRNMSSQPRLTSTWSNSAYHRALEVASGRFGCRHQCMQASFLLAMAGNGRAISHCGGFPACHAPMMAPGREILAQHLLLVMHITLNLG